MVEIMVQKNPHAMAIQTMFALAAAIVVGMLMKTFVPDTVNTALNDNIFSSISTMFLNALKMIRRSCGILFHCQQYFSVWRSEGGWQDRW